MSVCIKSVTEWLDGTTRPVRVGVYQRLFQRPRFAYWNGKFWGYSSPTPERAKILSEVRSNVQGLPWRGLAQKP